MVPLDAWLADQPVCVQVAGHSMVPFLEENDRVWVASAKPEGFSIGDIIVFMRDQELVVHRVVALRPNRFLEMGDAQERGNWHSWPEHLGRVLSVRRAKGGELDLGEASLRVASARRARLMRLRHLVSVASDIFPAGLLRRAFRKLARPLLRPSKPFPGLDE